MIVVGSGDVYGIRTHSLVEVMGIESRAAVTA